MVALSWGPWRSLLSSITLADDDDGDGKSLL